MALLSAAWMTGCASHAQNMAEVRDALLRGAPGDALNEFADQKEQPNDLLYLLERGFLEHEAGNYEASNEAFDAAELRAEELYTKSVSNELAALVTSDKVLPYRGYPHELVMIQYFRAFNYLNLGQFEGALVEARKANQRMVQLRDEKEGKDTYRNDAFMQYFTGLLYEDAGEWNDAAVAYRNAYNAYEQYHEMYGVSAPETLPSDLYRALKRIGADDEAQRLASDHPGVADDALSGQDANVVVFVEYGFAPYLEPVDIVLPIFDQKDDERYWGCDGCEREYAGVLVRRYGDNIYAYSGSRYTLDHVLRFAFPQVVDYPSAAAWARIEKPVTRVIEGPPAEPLAAIMRQSFNQRIPAILLKTIARALIKEFARVQAKKQDKTLGVLINIANLATEQADTRSWLLLPEKIDMVKLTLPPGQQDIEILFHAADDRVIEKQIVPVSVRDDKMTFVRVRCYQ
ncbi:MAG: hypothetical protein Kow0074_11510 [Candidatus Zixiibacteriota bacterium]